MTHGDQNDCFPDRRLTSSRAFSVLLPCTKRAEYDSSTFSLLTYCGRWPPLVPGPRQDAAQKRKGTFVVVLFGPRTEKQPASTRPPRPTHRQPAPKVAKPAPSGVVVRMFCRIPPRPRPDLRPGHLAAIRPQVDPRRNHRSVDSETSPLTSPPPPNSSSPAAARVQSTAAVLPPWPAVEITGPTDSEAHPVLSGQSCGQRRSNRAR